MFLIIFYQNMWIIQLFWYNKFKYFLPYAHFNSNDNFWLFTYFNYLICLLYFWEQNFHPFTVLSFSGNVDLKNYKTSTDFCCKLSNWTAVIPNFLVSMCHSNIDTCTLAIFESSIGSEIEGLQYKGPFFARAISSLNIVNCQCAWTQKIRAKHH